MIRQWLKRKHKKMRQKKNVDDGSGIDLKNPHVAALVLSYELLSADEERHSKEESLWIVTACDWLDMDASEAESLLQSIQKEIKDASDMFPFAQRVNTQMSMQEKQRVLVHLWMMALADDVIEPIEEHLIRKIAALLGVAHRHMIFAKQQARKSMLSG